MKALSSSKVVGNSLWIIIERTFSAVVIAVITILAARYLGTEQYGILNYGLTLATMFTAVMKLGIDSIIVNELINHKDRQGEFIGTSIVLRVASSILSLIAISLFLFLTNSSNPVLVLVGVIQSIVLVFQAGYIFDYWFQSHLISKYVSIAKLGATIATGVYSVYLLSSGKGIEWFAFSTVLTAAVTLLVMTLLYFKQKGPRLSVTGSAMRYLLSKSHYFIIANIISVVYVQIDKLIIGNLLGESQLGIYSAAVLLSTAWIFFPAAILTSIQPTVYSAKKVSQAKYMKRLKQMYFILFWTCTVICIGLTILAPLLIPLLFGSSYEASILILQVAVWAAPMAMLGMARNVWFVAEEKGSMVKYILLSGLILNVGANLIVIPIWGILGAAFVTVFTEFFVCFIAPLFFKSTRKHTKIVLTALVRRF